MYFIFLLTRLSRKDLNMAWKSICIGRLLCNTRVDQFTTAVWVIMGLPWCAGVNHKLWWNVITWWSRKVSCKRLRRYVKVIYILICFTLISLTFRLVLLIIIIYNIAYVKLLSAFYSLLSACLKIFMVENKLIIYFFVCVRIRLV